MQCEICLSDLTKDEEDYSIAVGHSECTACRDIRLAKKKGDPKDWVIVYRDAESKEMIGPPWSAESKIKPTRWAKAHCYTGCEYAVREGGWGVRDSELTTLEWQSIL